MMRRLSTFLRRQDGAAMAEFALILPVLTGLLMLGVEGWLHVTASGNLRGALQTGARYYEIGGTDDTTAQTLATSAWVRRPSDGAITLTRTCRCGTSVVACTSTCSDNSIPLTFIDLTGSGTFRGMMSTARMSEAQQVRVR